MGERVGRRLRQDLRISLCFLIEFVVDLQRRQAVRRAQGVHGLENICSHIRPRVGRRARCEGRGDEER
jgi:hypothetical protein